MMTLSTASLLLPVFFAREFLGIESKTPLKDVAGWDLFVSWAFFGAAIFLGVIFHFMSGKWVRLAWGQPVSVLRINASDTFVEYALDFSFWGTVFAFAGGLLFVMLFLFGYG